MESNNGRKLTENELDAIMYVGQAMQNLATAPRWIALGSYGMADFHPTYERLERAAKTLDIVGPFDRQRSAEGALMKLVMAVKGDKGEEADLQDLQEALERAIKHFRTHEPTLLSLMGESEE